MIPNQVCFSRFCDENICCPDLGVVRGVLFYNRELLLPFPEILLRGTVLAVASFVTGFTCKAVYTRLQPLFFSEDSICVLSQVEHCHSELWTKRRGNNRRYRFSLVRWRSLTDFMQLSGQVFSGAYHRCIWPVLETDRRENYLLESSTRDLSAPEKFWGIS